VKGATQGWPQDCKTYADFAAGIDSNRLPPSTALAGCHVKVTFGTIGPLSFGFAADRVDWSDLAGAGTPTNGGADADSRPATRRRWPSAR